MNEPTEAQKKIEALEDLLGVKLPHDRPIEVEVTESADLDLDKVIGGMTLQRHTRAMVALDWSKAIFSVTGPNV